MDAEVAIAYEQRVYLTKRQVRCCVVGRWSKWHDLTAEEAAIMDDGVGAAMDKPGRELEYRIARACWPLADALEGKRD